MEKIDNIIKEEVVRLLEYRDNNFKKTLLQCAYTLKNLHQTLISQGALKNDYTIIGVDKIAKELINLAKNVGEENNDWKKRWTVRY